MKLYTEERVREMLKSTHIHTDNDVNMILAQFTPIELPSDEEIEAGFDTHNEKYYIFTEGAKWVIEQIKRQNEKNPLVEKSKQYVKCTCANLTQAENCIKICGYQEEP